jgi:hypothetical protein
MLRSSWPQRLACSAAHSAHEEISGSICGAIAFEFDDAGIVVAIDCFCTNCRKVSGSQDGVYLQVRLGSFSTSSSSPEARLAGARPPRRARPSPTRVRRVLARRRDEALRRRLIEIAAR